MAITPNGIKLLVWTFFSAYIATKIIWFMTFNSTLPEQQQLTARSINYHAAHVLVAALTMATVTFPENSLVRIVCILLSFALLVMTFLGAWMVSSIAYPTPASAFSIQLLDSVMVMAAFMVAVNFKFLVTRVAN